MEQLETKKDLTPATVVRRWLLELKIADKAEKDWRALGSKILDKYRGTKAKKNSFNILWSNTETLRPSIYNSVPKVDIRRRFKDKDELGKLVGVVLERAAEFSIDTYDFDGLLKNSAMDMLLVGRAVDRVRYVPTLADEEINWEKVECQHVQWDDFRRGPGKAWTEVRWIAFRHRFNRDELTEHFGEVGKKLKLGAVADENLITKADQGVQELFQTLEVWEIWDKDNKKVLFISEKHPWPLKEVDDPLGLTDFWPIPRPLYAIEDSSSLIPVPLYDLYSEQAEELDRISVRINKLVAGLKMRGIYDATITELSQVMTGEDNDLIPAQNVMALLERGGLDKAIWFIPIEQAAKVLKELYIQRETTKQIIYEITGISDIIRGSSDASETATAQQIKNQWGTLRLQRMQREFQRYARDLIRLKTEIIAEKFQQETLMQMSGVKIPTAQEKQQAQAMGQPPPELPTWEEVIALMRDNAQRQYRIDIETDSTVASSLEGDMKGLQEVLGGITQLVQGLGPAVQMGAMPVEALKELVMVVCRRAKMGITVEDAFDKIEQPKPLPDPNAGKAEAEQAKIAAETEYRTAELAQIKELETMRMDKDADTKIKVAKISANAPLGLNEHGGTIDDERFQSLEQAVSQALQELSQGIQQIQQTINQPKIIERDASGRAVSVSGRQIIRDQMGNIQGLH